MFAGFSGSTKLYVLNTVTDVLGGRWRGIEEVPYYSGVPWSEIEGALKKEQQIPEVEVAPVSIQLPTSPQGSITTPMVTGVQSLTQSVGALGAEELKLAGFPLSTFLLVGLGLVGILFFGGGKHVS